MAAVGDPDPDFLTEIAVLIALAFEVVPEMDLRVDEDEEQQGTFLVVF